MLQLNAPMYFDGMNILQAFSLLVNLTQHPVVLDSRRRGKCEGFKSHLKRVKCMLSIRF